MRAFSEKYRIPAAVCITAALLILLSAFVSGVHRGRESAVSAVIKNVSLVNETSEDTVCDILKANGTENILLPEIYADEKPISSETANCRNYNETAIKIQNGSITVRAYNYAYLVEHEPARISDSAVKKTHDNIDYFITDNKDGTCTLLYYKDITQYTITLSCTPEKMIEACDHMAKF